MNEYLELHKALSEAEVEYQQKFDALQRFDDEIIKSGTISDPEKMIKERARLEAEEREAYEKKEAARKVYDDYRKRHPNDKQI